MEQIAIVTGDDADFTRGLVSAESPIGRALLGRRVGECVKARTPGGARVLSILGVEPMSPAPSTPTAFVPIGNASHQ